MVVILLTVGKGLFVVFLPFHFKYMKFKKVWRNALFCKNANSVIIFKSKLIFDLKCHICRPLTFFQPQSVFLIRFGNFSDRLNGKNISLREALEL